LAKEPKEAVFIDENSEIQINHDIFVYWFSTMVSQLQEEGLEDHEIPYYVFCAGAEAALRCQQQYQNSNPI
jgi:hypothetical protein